MENNRYREEEKEMDVAPETEIVEETKEVESDMSEENKKNKKHKKNHLYEENQALKKENAELKDQLLRNLAELENFKKRTNEERIKDRKYALADFLMQLIDTLDIFDKAVNKQTDDEKLKQFLDGFAMINKSFKQILERNGVKPIEALGKPFDPAYHSAIETVEVEGTDSNIVVEELMTGYIYKDRVLRPSMVKVSK
ncbi:MAG: nucleotide exchange factor GrpE [Bacilli bacterium]|nr:nucleotide exchange factor GrpE [Mollicutes bacterium]MDY3899416.1 nucleotide exchange factor GrpE [Bacilli bacterium]